VEKKVTCHVNVQKKKNKKVEIKNASIVVNKVIFLTIVLILKQKTKEDEIIPEEVDEEVSEVVTETIISIIEINPEVEADLKNMVAVTQKKKEDGEIIIKTMLKLKTLKKIADGVNQYRWRKRVTNETKLIEI